MPPAWSRRLCRAVLNGFDEGVAPLDGPMLERLMHLVDQMPVIHANSARRSLAIAALHQVLFTIDRANEHHDPKHHLQASKAPQAVYGRLDLVWPERIWRRQRGASAARVQSLRSDQAWTRWMRRSSWDSQYWRYSKSEASLFC
jgi:hypothetical protein